jgi:hypothetical protein
MRYFSRKLCSITEQARSDIPISDSSCYEDFRNTIAIRDHSSQDQDRVAASRQQGGEARAILTSRRLGTGGDEARPIPCRVPPKRMGNLKQQALPASRTAATAGPRAG